MLQYLSWKSEWKARSFCLGIAAGLMVCAAGVTLPAGAADSNPCPAPAHDYWTPDGRAGDLTFDVPGNWQRINDQGMVELVPLAEQGRSLTRIGFHPPQTLNGNVRQYFELLWSQWRRRFNTIDNGEPEIEQSPRGYTVMRRYSRIYAPSIGNGTFHLAVATMGNHAEAYFFIDNTGNVDYDQDFRSFEHTVQFAGTSKPELPEPGMPCGLNGIYVGWKRTAGLRGGIISEAIMKVETLVFFPDGNVIREMPQGGLKHFDFGKQIKQSRDSCGRYRMVGNQVRITWSDDTRAVGEREGTSLRIEGWTYAPAANTDGLRLNGTYRTELPTNGPRIRFTPDGRFVENGILDSIAYDGPDKSPGAGTYDIEQNTVELHYSNGRLIPLGFYVLDDAGPRPKQIHLKNQSFVIMQQ